MKYELKQSSNMLQGKLQYLSENNNFNMSSVKKKRTLRLYIYLISIKSTCQNIILLKFS